MTLVPTPCKVLLIEFVDCRLEDNHKDARFFFGEYLIEM